MRTKVDYRTHRPQTVRGFQVYKVTFDGRCVVCGRNTYDDNDGCDPRGIVDPYHCTAPLVASDFDMIGPDVPCCYHCRDTEETYKRAVEIAKSRWRRLWLRHVMKAFS